MMHFILVGFVCEFAEGFGEREVEEKIEKYFTSF
jgi:hypothetical protein